MHDSYCLILSYDFSLTQCPKSGQYKKFGLDKVNKLFARIPRNACAFLLF